MSNENEEGMTTVEDLEDKTEEIESNLGKKMKAIEQKKEDIRAKMNKRKDEKDILVELRDTEAPSKGLIKEAMEEVLCFGSIAYCCGSPLNSVNGHSCLQRDAFLSALDWTWEDYEEWKSEDVEDSFIGHL